MARARVLGDRVVLVVAFLSLSPLTRRHVVRLTGDGAVVWWGGVGWVVVAGGGGGAVAAVEPPCFVILGGLVARVC